MRKLHVFLAIALGLSFSTVKGQGAPANQTVSEQQTVQMTSDAGTDLAQTRAGVVPAKPKVTAESRLKEVLPKKFRKPGWKKEEKIMLSLGKYSFKCTNPATDKNFFEKRQFAAQTAVLLAKADMISRIKSTSEAYRSYKLFNDSEIKDSKTETMSNSVKLLSEGKLLGVTTMNQVEAWDGSKYEIAVMMVWSEKLEETARAIWIEKAAVQKPKEDGLSLEEWLEKQEIATMCGPWQYVDKNGIRWFIGVSARPVEGLSGADEIEAKETAKLMAHADALLSLKGDIYASRASEQTLVTKGNDEKIAKKFLADLSEACKAEVNGLGEVYSDTVTHPFTGSEIYVSVYAVSQESALAAIKAEDRSVMSEIIFNKGQAMKAGRNAANSDAINRSKNNSADFQKGYNQQQKKLQNQNKPLNQGTKPKQDKKQGQTGVSGGANVDYSDF